MHNLIFKGINKDGKKKCRFYLFFPLKENEKKIRIYINN